jgi:hypothetical protein
MGLTDTAWASRAGLRKETLSRLRNRDTCDFETLAALAQSVGSQLALLDTPKVELTPDGHFPTAVNRDLEEKLADLCAYGDLDRDRWASLGPSFFMAGLAVMLAGTPGYDRSALLALAECLHPGASEAPVFARWLDRSPVRPTRFLSTVNARAQGARMRHAS